jgi:hypothetical protein
LNGARLHADTAANGAAASVPRNVRRLISSIYSANAVVAFSSCNASSASATPSC